MGTVEQAFQQMIESLTVTDKKEGDVNRQRLVLRGKLDQHLSISQEFVAGSFGRKTAIHPLHDVDLLLVLNPKKHGELLERPPAACLQLIQSIIHKSYPEKGTPRLQRRSVNIEFSGTGIGFDIVPAFAAPDANVYQIPDRDLSRWIPTNPQIHRQKCNEANQKAGNKLKTLIKLSKHWSRQNQIALKSFHLEVMSYEVFSEAPKSYPEALEQLFKAISNAVLAPCADPAGLPNRVDEAMDEGMKKGISRKLLLAAKSASDAISASKSGDIARAHALWHGLLGSVYPERGRSAG